MKSDMDSCERIFHELVKERAIYRRIELNLLKDTHIFMQVLRRFTTIQK